MIDILLAIVSFLAFYIWARSMIYRGDQLDKVMPPWAVLAILIALAMFMLAAFLVVLDNIGGLINT